MLDLEGGSQGTFKVVAVDPTDPDSSRVIESNEVNYNAGVIGSFVPSVIRAESRRQGRQLEVTAVGTGLSQAHSLRITAPDYLWSVPLDIVEQTNWRLRAVADVPAALPEGVLEASHFEDAASLVPLPADQIVAMGASLPDTVLLRDPNPTVYPKDFAFYHNTVPTADPVHPWKGLFHLIYIRHYDLTGAEPSLAHAWSEDLTSWRVDTLAFLPNAGWDAQFVWAPSLQQVGNLYYMFYTGVDATGDQRIGYATTSLLDTTNTVWDRNSLWVYSADSTGWADPIGSLLPGQQQFRDPWVMPDPDSAGRFLLFNIGEDLNFVPNGYTVIGAARNRPGTLDRWEDLGAYRATDYDHTFVTRAESPLVARDSSGTGAWRIYFTNGDYDPLGHYSAIFATQSAGQSVADTTVGIWPELDSLYVYLSQNQSVIAWAATEHLQVGNVHLFAAYNGTGIGITRTYWDGNNFVIGYPDLTAVGDPRPEDGVRFFISGMRLGAPVRFVLDSQERIRPHLEVYDLAGRRVQTLLEGRTVQGRQEVRWDYRDGHGRTVSSGVYFARLTGAGKPRVLRVPVAH